MKKVEKVDINQNLLKQSLKQTQSYSANKSSYTPLVIANNSRVQTEQFGTGKIKLSHEERFTATPPPNKHYLQKAYSEVKHEPDSPRAVNRLKFDFSNNGQSYFHRFSESVD